LLALLSPGSDAESEEHFESAPETPSGTLPEVTEPTRQSEVLVETLEDEEAEEKPRVSSLLNTPEVSRHKDNQPEEGNLLATASSWVSWGFQKVAEFEEIGRKAAQEEQLEREQKEKLAREQAEARRNNSLNLSEKEDGSDDGNHEDQDNEEDEGDEEGNVDIVDMVGTWASWMTQKTTETVSVVKDAVKEAGSEYAGEVKEAGLDVKDVLSNAWRLVTDATGAPSLGQSGVSEDVFTASFQESFPTAPNGDLSLTAVHLFLKEGQQSIQIPPHALQAVDEWLDKYEGWKNDEDMLAWINGLPSSFQVLIASVKNASDRSEEAGAMGSLTALCISELWQYCPGSLESVAGAEKDSAWESKMATQASTLGQLLCRYRQLLDFAWESDVDIPEEMESPVKTHKEGPVAWAQLRFDRFRATSRARLAQAYVVLEE